MPYTRAQRTRVSAADVRELVSSATDLTSGIGRRVNRATDATARSETIPTRGTT